MFWSRRSPKKLWNMDEEILLYSYDARFMNITRETKCRLRQGIELRLHEASRLLNEENDLKRAKEKLDWAEQAGKLLAASNKSAVQIYFAIGIASLLKNGEWFISASLLHGLTPAHPTGYDYAHKPVLSPVITKTDEIVSMYFFPGW